MGNVPQEGNSFAFCTLYLYIGGCSGALTPVLFTERTLVTSIKVCNCHTIREKLKLFPCGTFLINVTYFVQFSYAALHVSALFTMTTHIY